MAEAESPDVTEAGATSDIVDQGPPGEAPPEDGGLLAGDPALEQGAAPDPGPTDAPYRVLARKYRPQTFQDLIGQEPMVQTLRNAFSAGRIAQAYMLTGVRGVGKTTTARILARALNYEPQAGAQVDSQADGGDAAGPTLDLPDIGRHCEAILASRHIDVIEIDAASNTSVDNIRDIIDAVPYRPVQARFKVYIIDEVHMLSKGAFNALLKTLEEPPSHVKFIFATTEIRKVPVTVLSRCQRFDLRRVDPLVMQAHLAGVVASEGVTATPEALSMIVRAGEGSVRDCLSILDQAIAHGRGTVEADIVRDMLGLADRAVAIDLFGKIMAGDIKAALEIFDRLYTDGAEPAAVLRDLANFTHLITRIRFVPEARDDADLPEELRKSASEFSQSLAMGAINRGWQLVTKGLSEVIQSDMPKQTADMVLVRLAHAATLPDPDKARAILEGGGAASGMAPETSAGPGAGSISSGAGGAAPTTAVSSSESASRNGQLAHASAGGAALSLASSQTEPSVQPRPEPARQPETRPTVELGRFEDLVALADEHRDILFKTRLERHVRLVRFEPPRIEFNLEPDAPGGLVQEISARLESWTGQRWIAILSREEGAPPLAEQRAEVLRARHAAVLRDPMVAAIMQRFPGAQVIEDDLELDAEQHDLDIGNGSLEGTPSPSPSAAGLSQAPPPLPDEELVYDDGPDDNDDDADDAF
jgi:DNA polymerase-3 subunit gamma/tau